MKTPIILSLLLCIWLLCNPARAIEKFPDATEFQLQSLSNRVDEFDLQRLQMVEQLLKARGIKFSAVLKAMSKVPRHKFVTLESEHLAYKDYPLSIGFDQTISQPYIVAYMTEALELSSNELVLEIGTGSGYQAAILGDIVKEVYTIETIPQLAERARQTLNKLGYKNVHVKTGNGYQGWAEYAPYDAIMVTAAPDRIPEALVNQLALNGRMVIPVGTSKQEIVVLTKTHNGLSLKRTIPVRFVPMTGK